MDSKQNFSFNCKKYTPCCNNTVLHINMQKETFLGDKSFLSKMEGSRGAIRKEYVFTSISQKNSLFSKTCSVLVISSAF